MAKLARVSRNSNSNSISINKCRRQRSHHNKISTTPTITRHQTLVCKVKMALVHHTTIPVIIEIFLLTPKFFFYLF
jgi:hypothetical protein